MSKCPFPEHHQSSGGGAPPVAVIVAVIIVAAMAGPVVRAATTMLEVAAVVLGVLLGLAVLVAAGVIVWRVRRSRVRRSLPQPARRVVLADRQERPAVGRPALRAIESPRDDVPTYTRVHAYPHVVTSRDGRPRRVRRDGWRL
jgi:hypothetical protein